ncbi:hypothetical protein ACFFGH_32885 [Lysobacter korlensis]|uniref:Uncharacterized protein n=1 Tax=Lysobacter korlensis TaxID=553636 RepID=A0ABV6S0T3_9GAMM
MRRLYYSSGYILIDDRTCKAVLRYARALAVSGKSDVVTVPVITDGGSRGSAHLLIGPASELFSTPVDNSRDAEYDPAVVEELERMTAELQEFRPAWETEMRDVPDFDL